MNFTKEEIAKTIDHTFLNPDGRMADIEKLCEEAAEYGFASVAIAPDFVEYAAKKLAGTGVEIDGTVGFPLGYNTTAAKVFEAREEIELGATELDMVVNIVAVKDHNWNKVKDDIQQVAEVCKDITFKVIFETCYLTENEIRKLAEICLEIKEVDYIKTSTGFGPEGATAENVKIMKEVVGDQKKVKAAGGVRTLADYKKMIEAGASRIGSSSGLKIIAELDE
ncbi:MULTISPECIES: deoxyribose-phosphate aldolase [Halanaerobium]|jgi:deoxyribose-phosphate aldolase|uniref:Deoxyribose-phosphate aldolase n=1 Tax=Halanaerobium kushneri TaxID=56779 RepID=A0A1N6ZJQ1_9FIRM|nr:MULTISPECIES: deoxyribose-phosphate aldolase [Halanaerobium]RCW60352.1 deoxyribose-phosphate aldolase [Halanaerobium sp. ST460_2HS_T2]SIR26994.1 deoxyribose-phosphate aldolase [Halanaerobium kushneri]